MHELYASDELRDAVAERWGPEVVKDGAVDRGAVAARVFANEDDRRWLEGMLWPRVGDRVALWKAEVDRAEPAPRAAVVEVPLLFEAGMEGVFDHTIAVVADEGVRERRAAARGHALAAERAGRQLTQAQKAEKADFTVRNDGSLDDLKQSLSRVLAKLDAT